MRQIRCVALDDEPLALKLIENYCERVPNIELLGTYSDPFDALTCIRTSQPDLIFLDIQMPDLTGLDIAGVLDKEILVIFTTAYKQYAVEGFNLNVVDYLLKPFDFNRFSAALDKVQDRLRILDDKKTGIPENEGIGGQGDMEIQPEYIVFKYNYQNHKLPVHYILYLEAYDNYVKIITQEKIYMPIMTLKNIEQILPEGKFVRVHKSFLVPVEKITSFGSHHVMIGDKELPIGKAYKTEFLKKMKP